MKGADFSTTEIGGDEFEGQETRIEAEQTAFFFDLLSRQIYRRPIESIVREITSNCFDSNIEAGIDDPVIIKIKEDENGWYISFNDFGVGLSPERIKKVYLSLGKSTKRDSDQFLGYFGMGSKVPFAYRDDFFINTNYNGIHYEYLYVKVQNAVPRLEKLIEKTTNEHNGTEVRIYFLTPNDGIRFAKACDTELNYFDNVYFDFDNWQDEIENKYTIYEKETFKYRPSNNYSKNMHIILGKVSYPIDWNTIRIEPIPIPIGIKFNIGELVVTPERESLRYVKFIKDGIEIETTDLIKQKIELVKQELQKIYNEKTVIKLDNLSDYWNYREADSCINFSDVHHLNIDSLIEPTPTVYNPLETFLFKIPNNPTFEYSIVGEFFNGKIRLYNPEKHEYRSINVDIFDNNLLILYPESGKFERKKNLYLTEFAKELELNTSHIYIIEHKPFKKVGAIKDTFDIKFKGLYSKQLTNPINYNSYTPNKNSNPVTINLEKTNVLKQVKLYRSVIADEIARHSFKYESIQIPKEWLNKYKAEHSKRRMTPDSENDEFIIYDVCYGLERKIISGADINKFTGFIIYGFKEDNEYLKEFANLFRGTKYNDKACKIIETAKKNHNLLLKYKNTIHVQDFMGDNKVFKKVATSLLIQKSLSKHRILPENVDESIFADRLEFIFLPVGEALNKLWDYSRKHSVQIGGMINGFDDISSFIQEIIDIALEQKLYDKELVELSEKISKYLTKLGIFKYITYNKDSIPFIIYYFKLVGKKINNIFDDENSLERDILNSYLDKARYMNEIYSNFDYNKYKKHNDPYYNKRYGDYSKPYTNHRNKVDVLASQSLQLLQTNNIINNYYELTKGN